MATLACDRQLLSYIFGDMYVTPDFEFYDIDNEAGWCAAGTPQ